MLWAHVLHILGRWHAGWQRAECPLKGVFTNSLVNPSLAINITSAFKGVSPCLAAHIFEHCLKQKVHPLLGRHVPVLCGQPQLGVLLLQ